MNTSPAGPVNGMADPRREVEAYCQALVDTGQAQWRVDDQGRAELHLVGGEAYLLGEFGVTRLR